jgi:adenine/guanine phosphoribosyltransferase-like PRPP-binding protein
MQEPQEPHDTEATTHYWQAIVDPAPAASPPWRQAYPATLPDGRVLLLPIRRLATNPQQAVASLIANQASLDVVDTLARQLAERLRPLGDVQVIGLPTLGLAFAPVVARELGLLRYVPLGYSRKFWYDEALSAPVQSITSPTPGKRIYLDPNQLPLVQGRRVVLVDDAVSTGTTLIAAWNLLQTAGAEVVACGVVMRQGRRWVQSFGAERAAKVIGVFDSPLLQAAAGGWVERD